MLEKLQKHGCQVRRRGAYGDIDSSEARERCMLGWESFPGGGKEGELGVED